MTILWSNNASTTVSGSITATSTTVALAAGTGILFPNPTGGDYYVATFYDQATKTQNEIVHVTGMSGDIATIVRAQEGTTAKAWNAGDIFANLVTAGTLRAFTQTGSIPAAPTTELYVGIDTSATPNLIVAVTNPVPAGYSPGMQFNIKVANQNTGPTTAQLNGQPALAVVRSDGSQLVGGNLVAGEEYPFIYNGTNFTSCIPPVPLQAPQNIFYVRTDSTSTVDSNGIESNSGFANTPTSAFRTIQGAVNTIKSRYISQSAITIRVADGTYTSGANDATSYIASWNIVGNISNPGACVVDCTSTNSATYVPGSALGSCFSAAGSASMYISGFSMKAYSTNAGTDSSGSMTLDTCWFSAPTGGSNAAIGTFGGSLGVRGSCQYTGSSPCPALFGCGGGSIDLGYNTIFGTIHMFMNIVGSPVFTRGTAWSSTGGMILMWDDAGVCSFTGSTPSGPQYAADSGGGIWFHGSHAVSFPGTSAGTVSSPGWVNYA